MSNAKDRGDQREFLQALIEAGAKNQLVANARAIILIRSDFLLAAKGQEGWSTLRAA